MILFTCDEERRDSRVGPRARRNPRTGGPMEAAKWRGRDAIIRRKDGAGTRPSIREKGLDLGLHPQVQSRCIPGNQEPTSLLRRTTVKLSPTPETETNTSAGFQNKSRQKVRAGCLLRVTANQGRGSFVIPDL